MTESDWTECANPHRMLDFLTKTHVRRRWLPWFRSRAERHLARKMFLFALACCRRLDGMLVDARCQQALEVAFRYADQQATKKEFHNASLAATCAALDASSPRIAVAGWCAAAQARAAEAVAGALYEHDPANIAAARAREAAKAWVKGSTPRPASTSSSLSSTHLVTAASVAANTLSPEMAWENEAKAQCFILRDVVGNPFRSVNLRASPVSFAQATVIAKRIYHENCFDEMPRIAEALLAGGIYDETIVTHCLQSDGHVHGCWVIDLLLNKSAPLSSEMSKS